MTIQKLTASTEPIRPLMDAYKAAIGEAPLDAGQYARLQTAADSDDIVFFVAWDGALAVGMCSLSRTFSTYACAYSGVFEDFYISPEYRHKGLAARLCTHVFDYCRAQGICTLWVGCADCDKMMYRHLGFELPLGNLLSWSAI